MVYLIFHHSKMEPLLTLEGVQRQTRRVPWLLCTLAFALTLQFATFILLLTLLLDVSPIVPDLRKIMSLSSTTVHTANQVIPDLNATLYDVKELMPDIRKVVYYAEAICKHTSGCPEYKS